MHFCFSAFSSKRGRPKLEKVDKNVLQRRNNNDLDVINILFYLNKITKDQLNSAHFYEQLYRDYQKSIDSPCYNTTSILKLVDKNATTKNHPDEKDEDVHIRWTQLKKILFKIKDCEEIIYKVVIEKRLKDDLLNPTKVMQNTLEVLRIGLDKITRYRSKRALHCDQVNRKRTVELK